MLRPRLPRSRRWVEQIVEGLPGLVGAGFRAGPVESFRELQTVYLVRDDRAVCLSEDLDAGDLSAALVRLVDGAIPADQPWVTTEPITWFALSRLLNETAPDRALQGLSLPRIRSVADRHAVLSWWDETIRTSSCGFLLGDPGWFDRAEAAIRRDVDRHPQHVLVLVPASTTDMELEEVLERERAWLPAEVTVEVRRTE